jgi:hypothetical protein
MPLASECRTVDEELIERSNEAAMAQFVILCILLVTVRKTTKIFGQAWLPGQNPRHSEYERGIVPTLLGLSV